MKALILLLANATSEHINTTVNTRDLRSPLHLACACGNLAIAQLLIWVSYFFNKIYYSIASRLTNDKIDFRITPISSRLIMKDEHVWPTRKRHCHWLHRKRPIHHHTFTLSKPQPVSLNY